MEAPPAAQSEVRSSATVIARTCVYEDVMMYVEGVHPPIPPQSVEPITSVAHEGADAVLPPTGDVIEISAAARLAAQVHSIPEVRVDLVERVKAEIEAGTYETQERIDITVQRLMQDLFE